MLTTSTSASQLHIQVTQCMIRLFVCFSAEITSYKICIIRIVLGNITLLYALPKDAFKTCTCLIINYKVKYYIKIRSLLSYNIIRTCLIMCTPAIQCDAWSWYTSTAVTPQGPFGSVLLTTQNIFRRLHTCMYEQTHTHIPLL